MHEVMILLGYIYIVLIFGGIIANLFIMAYIWINEIKENVKKSKKRY